MPAGKHHHWTCKAAQVVSKRRLARESTVEISQHFRWRVIFEHGHVVVDQLFICKEQTIFQEIAGGIT